MSAKAPEFSMEAVAPGRYALSGRVQLDNANQVLEQGERAFAGQAEVVVDLAGVSQVDSGGLAVLLEWRRVARIDGRRLGLESLPAPLLAIARLSGAEGFLTGPAG